MQTDKKILTIGIPTYNGAFALKPNLENLISIIENRSLSYEINILVSINASTDDSEEICKQYKKFDYFDYYIQKQNFGFDKNVDTVVNKSITPYVWILSDDDSITEKGLTNVLEILKRNSPSYIFINHKGTAISKSMREEMGEYKIYNNTEQFINEMLFACGLISSTIVSRTLWIEWKIEKYIGSAWIHMGYVIELLNHAPGNYISVFDIDYLDYGKFSLGARWGGNGGFLTTGLLLTNMILDNLDKKNKVGLYWGRKIIVGGWYSRSIFSARYNGLKLTKEIKKDIKRALSYNYIKYYLFTLPVILMPDFLIKYIGKCYKLLKRKTKSLKKKD